MTYNKLYGLDDELLFGKYNGYTIEEILNEDPSYIEWCINNIEGFDLDDEASELFDHFTGWCI